MKYLKYFLFATVILISSSFTTRTSGISEGNAVGSLMPEIRLNNEKNGEFSLQRLRGKKVLVSFWAAYDSESHRNNLQLWNALKNMNSNIEMISVSFDESKSVFEKTLVVDGIGSENQFNQTEGSNSEIFKKHRLERGFESYLIDENGIIIAKDIKPDNLKKKL